MIDRIGKGIRTAPRDAIISLSTPADGLGTAFGVHRALDTAGAMLGPLIAFGLLTLAPDAFDAVFVVSFFFAMIGLGLLVLFVRNPPRTEAADAPPKASVSTRMPPASSETPEFRRARRRSGRSSAWQPSATASSTSPCRTSFDFNLGFFPLLFVATALVYMILAAAGGPPRRSRRTRHVSSSPGTSCSRSPT